MDAKSKVQSSAYWLSQAKSALSRVTTDYECALEAWTMDYHDWVLEVTKVYPWLSIELFTQYQNQHGNAPIDALIRHEDGCGLIIEIANVYVCADGTGVISDLAEKSRVEPHKYMSEGMYKIIPSIEGVK